MLFGALRCWLLAGLWALSLLWSAQRARAAELSLTFFDIGQGDASLIVSPSGKRVLIDGGPPESGPRLVAALRRLGTGSLDLIILTHPHLDHLGGLKDVVSSLPVRMFLDAAYPSTSPAYSALLSLLAARGIALKQASPDRSIDIGDGATLLLLGPPSPWLGRTRSDINANSVVARLSWRGRSALFTGDAEPETESWLLARYQSTPEVLRAEVLKVPHHGSRFASTAPFLAAVRPQIAVVSVGARNDYGHPTPEALARLGEAAARVLRTDRDGEITLRSRDGQPFQVETRADPAPGSSAPVGSSPKAPARPSPPPVATPSGQAFFGSRRAQVFHRAGCPALRSIHPENLVSYPSREAALAAGRRPAADCRP